MSDIDFYADLIATGAVLGADRHWTPAELDELFDADNREYVEAVSTEALNLDYGLLEYFWERESHRAPWQGVQLSAQVHRLAIGWADTPALLSENYGAFEPSPSFAELRGELLRRDIPLVELPEELPGHRSWWQPESQAVAVEEEGALSGISAPGLLHDLPRARFDALRQYLHRLAAATPAEREQRLDTDPDGPDWWRERLTVFGVKLGWRESAEADWIPLYLSFAEAALRREALPQYEIARRVADTAARLDLYREPEPLAALPAAEELTTTLLTGVPLPRPEAESRWGVPGLLGAEVRPLLRARQLVETAARLRPFLRDTAVIAELGEWLRVWPEFGRAAGLLEMRRD